MPSNVSLTTILLILGTTIITITTKTTTAANLNVGGDDSNQPIGAPLPSNGAPVDEVVVESSLYIKPKPKTALRRTRRNVIDNEESIKLFRELKRSKRSPQRRGPNGFRGQGGQDYSQSQAASNAAANNQFSNPFSGHFGSSQANAGAQAFNAKGPAGSFGASSAGTITQAHNTSPFGSQNSAGASHSQNFVLPNGQTINFAATNSFANGPGGNNANSRGSSVSVGGGRG